MHRGNMTLMLKIHTLDNVTQSKLTLADFLKSFEKLLLLGAVSDNV
jgi:hypothetical protein